MDTLSNGLPRLSMPKLRPWISCLAIRNTGPRARLASAPPDGAVRLRVRVGRQRRPCQETVRTRALIEVLSPDSVRALDFDTYLDFDSAPDGGMLAEREPDSRAVLADFRADSAWVVEFFGTASFHDGAYWIDSQRFVLTGASRPVRS